LIRELNEVMRRDVTSSKEDMTFASTDTNN